MLIHAALTMVALAAAAPRIEMELATADQFSPLESQAWYRLLTELGVSQLRIRGQSADDRAEIEVGGVPGQRVYRVRGLLTDRGELLLPGGKFTVRSRAELAAWLERLRSEGPPAPDGKRRPFGLTPPELERVKGALAGANASKTAGLRRGDAIEQLDAQLDGIPLALDKAIARDVPRAGGGDVVSDELQGLSLGTALAAALRPAGLALQPRRTPQETLELVIVAGGEGVESWPIGWACDDPRDTLPKLYTTLNVELANITLDTALTAVAARLQAPLLVDHNGLAAIDVELTAVPVDQPAKKTSYSLLLRKILLPAKLKYEVRLDDAGKAFLWVTPARLP